MYFTLSLCAPDDATALMLTQCVYKTASVHYSDETPMANMNPLLTTNQTSRRGCLAVCLNHIAQRMSCRLFKTDSPEGCGSSRSRRDTCPAHCQSLERGAAALFLFVLRQSLICVQYGTAQYRKTRMRTELPFLEAAENGKIIQGQS